MKLSAIVITKNEAATVERCLRSLSFARERIVIDSGSTDNTVAVAAAAGAKVLQHDWPGYGAQKNFGSAQATGEWVLFVDADEEVTPTLAEQIRERIDMPQPDFYWVRIVTVFLGRPLKHLYGHNPRLFRKRSGSWTTAAVHEQVQTRAGTTIRLGDKQSRIIPEPLLHYSHTTIASYLESMHRYTSLDAQEMYKTGKHRSGRAIQPTPFLPWQLAMRQSLKLLFYRRGVLDGWAGIVWCILSGYYEFEMAQKYRSLCV